MSILIFDIETIPDLSGMRSLLGLSENLSDEDIANIVLYRRRQQNGTEFLPIHQQCVIAISYVWCDLEKITVGSLGDETSTEVQLITSFFKIIEKHNPQLISWNGKGFDMPVLQARALIHKIRAQRYWDAGEIDKDTKWNNYTSRYHNRHLDLMDVLALYNGRNVSRLDEMAQLCGLPGKLGMSGEQVWPAYQAGKIAEIRHYCETDAMNTYLLYLRFQLMRGTLDTDRYEKETQRTHDVLRHEIEQNGKLHWREFIENWQR